MYAQAILAKSAAIPENPDAVQAAPIALGIRHVLGHAFQHVDCLRPSLRALSVATRTQGNCKETAVEKVWSCMYGLMYKLGIYNAYGGFLTQGMSDRPGGWWHPSTA